MKRKTIQTGMELREARLDLGLDMDPFARALGLGGKTPGRTLGFYERGERPIPRHVALLTECFLQGARPSSWPNA